MIATVPCVNFISQRMSPVNWFERTGQIRPGVTLNTQMYPFSQALGLIDQVYALS